jgi:hypothetical protein
MKWVRRLLLSLAGFVLALVVSATALLVPNVREAGASVDKAERIGWLRKPTSEAPLSLVERAVIASEFGENWNRRWVRYGVFGGFLTARRTPSYALSRVVLLSDQQLSQGEWKRQSVFVSYVLEWRCSDKEILRMWLSSAAFGDGMRGLNNASLRLFGLPPQELDVNQCIELALRLRNPNLKNSYPDVWIELANRIRRELARTEFL